MEGLVNERFFRIWYARLDGDAFIRMPSLESFAQALFVILVLRMYLREEEVAYGRQGKIGDVDWRDENGPHDGLKCKALGEGSFIQSPARKHVMFTLLALLPFLLAPRRFLLLLLPSRVLLLPSLSLNTQL